MSALEALPQRRCARCGCWLRRESVARGDRFCTPCRPTAEDRPGGPCVVGHDPSEIAWRPDRRSRGGGYLYCRACRRARRRAQGWA